MIKLLPVLALLLSAGGIAALLASRVGHKIQDVPNARSLHTRPTPRIGGLGVMAGILAAWAMLWSSLGWWLVLPLIALLIVSLLDDIHNLPVRGRLLVQLIAGVVLVAGSGVYESEGIMLALATVFFCVWMTNLYNFMDGSNGLAGGMTLFGFAFYGVAAWMAQDETFALLSFSVSAAALGFLYFNFPQAKVFMGDAGSIPLGFLAASMGVWGWVRGLWPVWFPLLVFSPFIIDATATLIKRAIRGAKITEAHREHYYQRAIQMGLGHRNLALLEYVLMLCVGSSGLMWLQHPFPPGLIAVWAAIYTACMMMIDVRWARFIQGQIK